MTHIAILVHRDGPFEDTPYYIWEIARVWREMGLQVSILYGTATHVPADLLISHIDLTVVPASYRRFAAQYPVVLNGQAVDISKRAFSQELVRRGDGYNGPVIVKTNRNCGGSLEARLALEGPWWRRRFHEFREGLPWTYRSRLASSKYKVYDSVQQVPRVVWYNPDLIVERFLAERQDDNYCLRLWKFLGDRETVAITHSPQKIVKGRNVVRRESIEDVPEELRRKRRELGFDFGKFDYAIVDGRPVLYDVNRTPSLGIIPLDSERTISEIRALAEGIRSFL